MSKQQKRYKYVSLWIPFSLADAIEQARKEREKDTGYPVSRSTIIKDILVKDLRERKNSK